jgi:general secretion pathway protein L
MAAIMTAKRLFPLRPRRPVWFEKRARLDLWLPPGWPSSPGPIFYRWHAAAARDVELDYGVLASLAELEARLAAVGARPDPRVVIWVPASEALLFSPVHIPARRTHTLTQALPYALEDQLLEEPEQLHFAFVRHGEALAVAVTARERMARWLAALEEPGWRADALGPAVLSLPLPEAESWTLACLDQMLLVRQGPFSGFGCLGPFEPATPPALLAAALAEARAAGQAPQRLVRYDPPWPEPISPDAWAQALGVAIEDGGRDFRFFSPPLPALDLRQGPYAPRGGWWREPLRGLWPAAAMLAIAIAGTLLVDVIEWWRLQRAEQALAQAMRTLYTTAFPQSKTVLDPYRQLRRELERLEASASNAGSPGSEAATFVVLLARAATALKDDPRLVLEALRYQPSEGLVLEIAVPDAESVQAFAARLRRDDLLVETLADDERRGELKRARLRLRATGAKRERAPARPET